MDYFCLKPGMFEKTSLFLEKLISR